MIEAARSRVCTPDLRQFHALPGVRGSSPDARLALSDPGWCWTHQPGVLIHYLRKQVRTDAPCNHGARPVTNTRPAAHSTCPKDLRTPILAYQDYRCLYCLLRFGSVVTGNRRNSMLTVVHWDHFIPYSYLCCSPGDNWVAACNVCNRYKHDHMYATLDEARTDIMGRWDRDRRECAWEPSVSSEFDAARWAVKFASWLSLSGIAISSGDPEENDR